MERSGDTASEFVESSSVKAVQSIAKENIKQLRSCIARLTGKKPKESTKKVKAVEIIKKEDSNQLPSILARHTGEKSKVKKKVHWVPDVVDPQTNKEEYLQKHLMDPNDLVEEKIASSEENNKNETSHENSITNSNSKEPVKLQRLNQFVAKR